ncbi:MAG: DNA-binding response regulator [Deltaproteobacteria bacterium]|nr:DNA-binding response regulator [Deltaproteobacteria bacterium]
MASAKFLSEALIIKRTAPDLLILDLTLPDLNGIQVCSHLRQKIELDPENPTLIRTVIEVGYRLEDE